MMRRRFAALAACAVLYAGSAPAQDKLPPLRTGVDGTFAPHAMPKLGGGVEGFQIDLFTEVARRMKREIIIDAVSFSTLIPGMQAGRYDFIAAPTTVTAMMRNRRIVDSHPLLTESQGQARRLSGAFLGTHSASRDAQAPRLNRGGLSGLFVECSRLAWKLQPPDDRRLVAEGIRGAQPQLDGPRSLPRNDAKRRRDRVRRRRALLTGEHDEPVGA